MADTPDDDILFWLDRRDNGFGNGSQAVSEELLARAASEIRRLSALVHSAEKNTRAAPKVKPLEWADHPLIGEPVWAMAVTNAGTYFIVDDTDDFSGLWLSIVTHKEAKWWGDVKVNETVLASGVHDDDMGPLKTAAQADYERRILSALDLGGDE